MKEISKKQLIMMMPLTQGNCNPDSEVSFTSLYFGNVPKTESLDILGEV